MEKPISSGLLKEEVCFQSDRSTGVKQTVQCMGSFLLFILSYLTTKVRPLPKSTWMFRVAISKVQAKASDEGLTT